MQGRREAGVAAADDADVTVDGSSSVGNGSYLLALAA
jgi:hypothetical protein